MNATALATCLPSQAEPEGDLAAVERLEADRRVDRDLDDLVRAARRDLLDLDAALGRRHQGHARGRAVDDDAEIELVRDLAALLDEHPADLAALRARSGG